MNQHPLFTIVTVSFNCVSLIEQTMDSVIRQSFKDWEYIVIDGGSTDGTANLIRSNASSLSFWCSEPDGGIYEGMNKGIARAHGKWILFLNAGDTLADERTLEQVAPYAQENAADVLYGDILISRNGKPFLKVAEEPRNKHRMYFCHQAAFTRTSLLRAQPFDTRFRFSADLYSFKSLYLSGHIFRHVPVTVAHYDTNGVSNTRRVEGLRDNMRVIRCLDKGIDRIKFLCKLSFVIGWAKLRGKA